MRPYRSMPDTLQDSFKLRDERQARANDRERQKGLNALPFSEAINAYPDNENIDPQDAFSLKQLGMVEFPEPPPEAPEVEAESILPNLDNAPAKPSIAASNKTVQQEVDEAEQDMGLDFDPEMELGQPSLLDRLMAAQEAKNRDQTLDVLLRAGIQAGTAISGQGNVAPNYAIADAIKGNIGSEIEDLKQETQFQKIAQQQDDDAKRRSKTSEISEAARQSVASQLRRMGNEAAAKSIEDRKLSYQDLRDLYGETNLSNMLTAYEAQQNRLAIAQERSAGKVDDAAAKAEDKITRLRQNLRKELKDYDEKTGLITSLTTYESLKDRLDKGQFSGIDDVRALYTMIKALDPTSVVRESEVELLQMSNSQFSKIMNTPKRFFKGDIFDPKYRKQLVAKLGAMAQDNVKAFRRKSAGTFKEIERQGLNPEEFLSDELPIDNILGRGEAAKAAPEVNITPSMAVELKAELERRKKK